MAEESRPNGAQSSQPTPITAPDGDSATQGSRPNREQVESVPPGTLLGGRYRVVTHLGSGGMGTVYEVYDNDLEELVALKLLHPKLSADKKHRRRIRSEVRLARRVSHPNVCRVHDLGYHQNQLYVTMEHLRGRSLRALFREKGPACISRAPLARRIDIVVQICAGLAAAHAAGVLHRDVKPDNVIVEDDGRAVLTDFGIASLSADMHSRLLVAGTPGYIAPEVLRGEAVDHRVDVFASAILTWELIARKRPWKIRNLKAARRHAYKRPPIPSLSDGCAPPLVKEALDRALEQALQPDPRQRTPNVELFAEAIARAARGEDSSILVPTPPVTQGWSREAISTIRTPTRQEAASSANQNPSEVARSDTSQSSGTRRAQIRVVSSLTFRTELSAALANDSQTPTDLSSSSFTAVSGLSAENYERIVVDLGGTPLIATEESISAVFGAPVAFGDDAARAARAALALVDLASGQGRVGIETGRVLFRVNADGTPSASGDAVSRSRELATQAAAGEVRITPVCARHLVGRFKVSDTTELSMSYERQALLIEEETFGGPVQDSLKPVLMAREKELSALEELVQRVCEHRIPGFGAVLGEQGFGKGRVRMELVNRFRGRRDIDWLTARATPLGEAAPLGMLHQANPSWFQAATRKELRNKQEAFAAARRWLELRAARRPVGVLFEDAHWADDATLELLLHLRDHLFMVPVAVVLFGRPELFERLPTWGQEPDAETAGTPIIRLGPLGEQTARSLVRAIAPSATQQVVDELVDRAEGNPYFIEELARNIPHQNLAGGGGSSELPPTVESVIQARLDRLSPLEHNIACGAAVVGREFWREGARAALLDPSGVSDMELDQALAELERRGIVFALPPSGLDDDRYAFKHSLVRDVAYQQLAPRDRRRTHIAIGQWLKRRAQDAADKSLVFSVAHHLDLGGDRDGAREAYRRAGEQSLDMFAYHEAAKALRRARELSSGPDLQLLERLGDALAVTEGVETANAAYLEALDLAGGNRLVLGRLYEKIGGCYQKAGDSIRAIEWFERGLATVAPNDELIDEAQVNPTVPAALYSSLGWTLGYIIGDVRQGLPLCERAVELLEGTPHRSELAHAYSRLATNYMRVGRIADQLRGYQRQLEIGKELASLELQCYANVNIGVAYTGLGAVEDAIRHTREGIVMASRMGDAGTVALARNNLGGLLLELGETAKAKIEIEEAIRMGEQVRMRTFLAESHNFLARLHYLAGDLERAIELARHALDLAEAAKDTYDQGISERILGLLLAKRGDLDEATQALGRSHKHLEGADPCEEARTDVALARFLRIRREPGDAKRADWLLQSARETFEELGASLDRKKLDDPDDIR